MDSRVYELEEKVFARVKGYPPWPARILDITRPGTKNAKFLVFFYGTKESANLKNKDIFPFFENLNTLGRPKKQKYFNEAMKDIVQDFTPEERKMYALESGAGNDEPLFKVAFIPNKSVKEESNDERKQSPNKSTTDLSEDSNIQGSARFVACSPSSTFSEVSRYGRKIKPKSFPDEVQMDKPLTQNITITLCNETVTIPMDDKALAFHTTAGTLMDIDSGIRDALSIGKPDLDKAIILLDDLLKLDLTPFMLKKLPDIVDVIRKTMRFFGSPPKRATALEIKEFNEKSEIIRDRSGMAYQRFESLFDVPPREDFYEHFKRERDHLHEKYKDKLTDLCTLTDL